MEKKTVFRKDAPSPGDAPYSPAVTCGSLVFVSGQIPVDVGTGIIISGDFEAQAEQAFRNLEAVLKAAGSSLDKVVKTTAFLLDMADFGTLNEVYRQWFPGERPARSCVAVSELPMGARVEIEAVAILQDDGEDGHRLVPRV